MSGPAYNAPVPSGRAYLFPEELVERFNKKVTESTLEKWRGSGEGPPFAYLGRFPIYPIGALVAWENALPTVRSTAERRAPEE